jgi:hypothetical protein
MVIVQDFIFKIFYLAFQDISLKLYKKRMVFLTACLDGGCLVFMTDTIKNLEKTRFATTFCLSI